MIADARDGHRMTISINVQRWCLSVSTYFRPRSLRRFCKDNGQNDLMDRSGGGESPPLPLSGVGPADLIGGGSQVKTRREGIAARRPAIPTLFGVRPALHGTRP